MKYCVKGRQSKTVQDKADQIKVRYEDRARLIDYIDESPEKDYILYVPKGETELDWELFKAYNEKVVNFMLCIEDLNLAKECHEQGIDFYWAYPCYTWYDLRGILELKPCYVILGAPLSFSLEKVIKACGPTGPSIRLCPNLAYDAYIPRESGIYGTWIRPEDVEYYEKYVAVLEFETKELRQEAALLHIYKEEKIWPGNLNLLITNLGYNIDNRSIDEELGQYRMNCGQRCMSGSPCRLCETCFKLGNSIRDLHYKKLKAEHEKN